MLKELGVSRVVLAREVPLEEIKKFNELGIDLEIFIHGALCFSYSGMCYLSYYKGGRSGNRGNCAQPCRQNYELFQDGEVIADGALLSMKDLNTINRIEKVLSIGVTSLKIEGRAKSLEYLASVIKVYRRLIDEYNRKEAIKVEKELLDDLYSSFSRETTNGYLFNESNEKITTNSSVKHQGIYIGKVIEYKKGQIKVKLNNELEILDGIRIIDDKKEVGFTVTRIIENGKLVKSSSGTVYIDVKEYVGVNAKVFKTQSARVKKEMKSYQYTSKSPAKLKIEIKQNKQTLYFSVNQINIVKEFNKTLEKARNINDDSVINQFKKVNSLPIEYVLVDYKNDDNLYIPIPEINEMRRLLLEEVKQRLENQLEREFKEYKFKDEDNYIKEKPVDEVSFDGDEFGNDLINSNPLKKESLAFHLSEIDKDSAVSPYFGVNNHLAVNFFRNMTNGIIVLSYESSSQNALEISKYDKGLGYLISFNEPLMVAKHCVVAKACGKEGKHCGMCLKHQYQLKDGSNTYNLKFHNCIMRIEGKKVNRKAPVGLIGVKIE